MFRLPFGERVDPMEEKRQARVNTINNVLTFALLCAAIRIVGFVIQVVNMAFADPIPRCPTPRPQPPKCKWY